MAHHYQQRIYDVMYAAQGFVPFNGPTQSVIHPQSAIPGSLVGIGLGHGGQPVCMVQRAQQALVQTNGKM